MLSVKTDFLKAGLRGLCVLVCGKQGWEIKNRGTERTGRNFRKKATNNKLCERDRTPTHKSIYLLIRRERQTDRDTDEKEIEIERL